MPTPHATAKQVRALHIKYKVLAQDNDPRIAVNVISGLSVDDIRAHWTKAKIGRIAVDPDNKTRPSWKGLTFAEAAYLMDYLSHKNTPLDRALEAEFSRLAVTHKEEYFERYCIPKHTHSKNVWTYGGRCYWDLHFKDKYELLKTLKTRQPARRAG